MHWWQDRTDTKRVIQQERENVKRRGENHIFWQLELALAVITRDGSGGEGGIRQNKASPRKTKAPLSRKKNPERKELQNESEHKLPQLSLQEWVCLLVK